MPAQSEKRRILLVDDHPLLRQGIAQLINAQDDLVTCAEASDRHEALRRVEEAKPDLAIVDLSLSESRGLELIKDLQARFPEVRTLVLSMHDEMFYAERALRAGARGYVMKRDASSTVLAAIREVLAGKVFVSDKVKAAIVERISTKTSTGVAALDLLSDRELEVLLLIGQGHGMQQIGTRLHISAKTVEAHRANIKTKLQLKSGSELLRHAIRWSQQVGES